MSILVALTTLGIKHGDKVIVSPMACLASTQPLLSIGIEVIWADIDPKLGTLDPESVRKLMRLNPKAIIHNHFCGYPGHISEINDIGKEFGIPIIDDCIEAFGSEYKGQKLGNLGTDVTIFSFNPVRFPNTLDGGAVIFNDKSLYEKSIIVRDAGIDRTIFRDEYGEISSKCDIKLVGHSATPMELATYIGTQQMKHSKFILNAQRKNAKLWEEQFCEKWPVEIINNPNSLPNYWVFGILVQEAEKLSIMLKFREKGYYASGVHLNNNNYSVFGTKRNLKGVTAFQQRFIAIPSGWWVEKIKLCHEI